MAPCPAVFAGRDPLVEALLRRRQAKAPALTIASCDNIAGNGELLRALVLSFAESAGPHLHGEMGQAQRYVPVHDGGPYRPRLPLARYVPRCGS